MAKFKKDGIHIWHIHTAFHYGGGQKHIIIVVGEIYHCFLKLLWG